MLQHIGQLQSGPNVSVKEENIFNDDLRSGRPLSELTNENIELVRQVITNDPHSTYDDIIAETFLSHGTVERIISS